MHPKVTFRLSSPNIASHQHAQAVVPGALNDIIVAYVYPWYDELSPRDLGWRVQGYAWLTTTEGERLGVPRVAVKRDDKVPTFEAAMEWCRWYIEEGPR
jgi:hypothetical protein